jgi:hypothetical protein
MSKRKKIPLATETDILEKSGRRCCVCYALHRNFKVKKGQVAHLDHDPANFRFDNLCFLCQYHHDEYDAKRRQSKGLTHKEVKQYRLQLYETVAKWRESTQALSNSPVGFHVPLLNFFQETSPAIKTTTQGLQVVERQAGFRVADKDNHPALNLDIHFNKTVSGSRAIRILHIAIGMSFGLTMQVEVCAYDDWTVSGFMNVLRNALDIWLLRGEPLENDERDPMLQPRDSLLLYRTSDGENRLIISTHAISETAIQIHARFSDRVAEGLANYLDTVGFTRPFKS